MIETKTIDAVEIFKKHGITSLFGKKPIEEEKKVIIDVTQDLSDVYIKLLAPWPLSEEEEKVFKEKIQNAIKKLEEIL